MIQTKLSLFYMTFLNKLNPLTLKHLKHLKHLKDYLDLRFKLSGLNTGCRSLTFNHVSTFSFGTE